MYSYNRHGIDIPTSFKDRRQNVTLLIISCLNYLRCIIQKKKAPTTLIELSDRDLKRFKKNNIHLDGLLLVNDESNGYRQTIYSQVTYGSNLSISKKKVDIGEQKWYQYVT